MIIRLTDREREWGIEVGTKRREEARRMGKVNNSGNPTRTTLVDDIDGAWSEIAVCKALGQEWTASVNTFKSEADIPPFIDVKSTRHLHGHLILRFDDRTDRKYVLVIAVQPDFRIAGWIPGDDTFRKDCWLTDFGNGGQKCYGVSQWALWPIEGINDWIS